jgi:ABC-type transporter Mla subunit MlaD
LETLLKSVGDQSRVLGALSKSGENLLSQLNATEVELEAAKKQLAVTLANFEAQRKAAGQVSEELGRIDARQREIALETEELGRILDGQQPITRHDLQRANVQGWIFGSVVGFLTSFLASIAYNALRKRGSFSN